MAGSTAQVSCMGATRLTCMRVSMRAWSIAAKGQKALSPARCTTISGAHRRTDSPSARTSPASARSAGTKRARGSMSELQRSATETRAPASSRRFTTRRPMPPLPPVTSTSLPSGDTAHLGVAIDGAEHVREQAERVASHLDDGALVVGVGDAIDKGAEEFHVLLVEAAMGVQVGKGVVGQAQGALDRGGAAGRDFGGCALEHEHHAE